MRIVFTLLLTYFPLIALSDNYKVVINGFPTKKEAQTEYHHLQNNKNTLISSYSNRHDLLIHYRQSGQRYIIVIEPFNNRQQAEETLQQVSKEFPKAFVSRGVADNIDQLLIKKDTSDQIAKDKNRSELKETVLQVKNLAIQKKPSTHSNDIFNTHSTVLTYPVLSLLILFLGYLLWREWRYRQLSQRYNEVSTEKERIQNSIQAKNDFIAMMSHEIRAPINAIMGISHLVLESRLTVSQRAQITKMRDSAALLLNLINDILDHSKIEAGKVTIEQIPFDLNALLDDIANIVSHKAHEKEIELVFDIDRSVPNKLIGDPLRLLQVLVNLLNNAIKFTEQGNVILRARGQQISRLNLKIHFEVIDTGIGMDKDQLANLFQSYSQADETISRKYGGTGLGLAICKNLVSLMGGTIQVQSTPKVGTTFAFDIKLHSDFDFEKRHYRLPTPDLMSKNALILDENTNNATVLQRGLEYFHYEVKTVLDSFDAVALFKGYTFDIVFIDTKIALCGEFKRELQNRIKTDDLKLVWLGEDTKKRGGFVLAKPFNQLDIFNAILSIYGYMDQSGKHQNNTKKLKDSLKKFAKETLLLAEDNEINRSIIAGLLAGTNISLLTAQTGQEAIEIVEKRPDIRVILMDIQMPIMDGFEASKILRQHPEYDNIPIIAVTGNAMESDVQNISNAGMNGHIVKPIEVNTFYTTLYYAFEKSHNSTQLNRALELSTKLR